VKFLQKLFALRADLPFGATADHAAINGFDFRR
jgi:hypothetical protein